MISTDFAPNETKTDALHSLALILQPWLWYGGSAISKAQRQLGQIFLKQNIFFFLNGRSALFFYLKSLGLKKGDQVLVQAFTCEAVVLPMMALGLEPVYVDISLQTYSMDLADLQKKVTGRSRLLVLQHTFGILPQDREKILAIARRRKMLVLEDLAHGFDPCFWEKDQQPTTKLLSFGRTKFVSSVMGGAIVTMDEKLSRKLQRLKLPRLERGRLLKGLLYKPFAFLIKETYRGLGRPLHFLVKRVGLLGSELTNLEKRGQHDCRWQRAYPSAFAKLLLLQLERLSETQTTRREASCFYDEAFRVGSKLGSYALLRYPILVEEPEILLKKAKQLKIFLGRWYDQPVAPRGLDLAKVGYRLGSCPIAERVCERVVNLPTGVNLDKARQITALIREK